MAYIFSQRSAINPKTISKFLGYNGIQVVLVLFCTVPAVLPYGFYSRGPTVVRNQGKIRANLPGVELGDYRFGLGDPYVIFYERDNYRGLLAIILNVKEFVTCFFHVNLMIIIPCVGDVYFHRLERNCTNLHESRQNWASSMDVQKRCVKVCEEEDCNGHCEKIYAHPEDPNNKGASKLSSYNINDKVKSVKFCYP